MARGASGTVGSGRWRAGVVALAIAALASACGGDEEPELTFEDRLVELEGRALTPAEVADRVEIGETLCLLEDRILDEMWQQLSDQQLDFQDLIIAELCPERAVLYAGHTGRFVTEEAEDSGVRTSTTRPTSTTTTSSRPTTTRATSGATGSSTDATDPDAPPTADTTPTSASTSLPSTTSASSTATTTAGPPSSR